MQRLLLTGTSGFLGSYFTNQYKNDYEIIGISNKSKLETDIENYKVDISDTKELEKTVLQIKPDIIVHTAAISSIAACAANPVYSALVNVTATKVLATIAKQLGAQFVFTSTDMVFDGTKSDYTEEDKPNPTNIYGQQKLDAEKEALENNAACLILRIPLLVGNNNKGTSGVIADLQQHANEQKTANLFTDEIRTPLHVTEVCKAIHFLIQKKATGIIHVAGKNKYSRYSLGVHLKDKYKLENVNIQATTHQEQQITNRPKDVSLNIDKLLQLGFTPSTEL